MRIVCEFFELHTLNLSPNQMTADDSQPSSLRPPSCFEQVLAKAQAVRYYTIRIVSYEECRHMRLTAWM